MAHTFKVKWATRKQAEEVAKILEESTGKNREIRLKNRFGKTESESTWLEDHGSIRGKYAPLLEKRDLAFSKKEATLLKMLNKDGFKYSHVDEDGFDVYVQEEPATVQTSLVGALA
jgi:hypothetical protein